jgi:hypothetical protein
MALSKITNASVADTAVHGRRNLIINGAARVQQRNATTTTAGQYGKADRFRHEAGGGTTTLDAGTVSSSDAPYSEGFRNTIKITNTTAGSAATTDYAAIQQRIEAQDLVNSGWDYTSSSSYLTLSFWAKSSLAGDYQVNFRTADGTQYNYISEFTLAANTWKKITVTLSGNSSLTINDDNGIGIQLYVWTYLGTNYTTSGQTLDAWSAHSGSSQGKDFPQNWKSTASATFEITGLQLEVGDTATPFEHRSYGEEVALCQRYYNRYTTGGTEGGIMNFAVWSAQTKYGGFTFTTEMRASPTFSVSALSDFNFYTAASTGVPTAIERVDGDTKYAEMRVTHSSLGNSGNSGWLRIIDATNGWAAFDAEL